MLVLFCILVVLSAHPAWSAEPTGTGAASENEANAVSLTEVNKQLTNPVSSFWSLSFQQNNYLLNNPDRWSPNLQVSARVARGV